MKFRLPNPGAFLFIKQKTSGFESEVLIIFNAAVL